MASKYKIRKMLKNLPFYSEEIVVVQKTTTLKNLIMQKFYLNYHYFLKNLKNYVIINCQKNFHFFQKNLKS